MIYFNGTPFTNLPISAALFSKESTTTSICLWRTRAVGVIFNLVQANDKYLSSTKTVADQSGAEDSEGHAEEGGNRKEGNHEAADDLPARRGKEADEVEEHNEHNIQVYEVHRRRSEVNSTDNNTGFRCVNCGLFVEFLLFDFNII